MAYDRETNPKPEYRYDIIRLSEDKNTHEILSSFDTILEAMEELKKYNFKNVHINMYPKNKT